MAQWGERQMAAQKWKPKLSQMEFALIYGPRKHESQYKTWRCPFIDQTDGPVGKANRQKVFPKSHFPHTRKIPLEGKSLALPKNKARKSAGIVLKLLTKLSSEVS